MNIDECIANCSLCKRAECVFDEENKNKYTVTQKCLDAWERRKNTMTATQKRNIEYVEKVLREGGKKDKKYWSAYQSIKYLKYRDKYLATKKAKYHGEEGNNGVQQRVLSQA